MSKKSKKTSAIGPITGFNLNEALSYYVWSCKGTMATIGLGLIAFILGYAHVWEKGQWVGWVIVIIGAMVPIGVGHFRPYLLPIILLFRFLGMQVNNKIEFPKAFWISDRDIIGKDANLTQERESRSMYLEWFVKVGLSVVFIGLYMLISNSVPIPISEPKNEIIIMIDKNAPIVGSVVMAIGMVVAIRGFLQGSKV